MSAASRTAIAAAANSVSGIHCNPYFVQTTKAGDAMVRLQQITYPNVFGGVATWQVLVLLPQDIATAERYLEEKVPALVEALGTEMTVTTVQPQQLALETGSVPCVVIEGTRATEE
jgi:hypothetical protein